MNENVTEVEPTIKVDETRRTGKMRANKNDGRARKICGNFCRLRQRPMEGVERKTADIKNAQKMHGKQTPGSVVQSFLPTRPASAQTS